VARVVDTGQREAGTLAVESVAPEAWERIGDWDEVVAESAAPSIFLTRDWISAWWDSFGAGLDPCLLRVAAADGRTLGIAPIYLERLRVPATRLGLLGDRVVGSEYLGLAARRGSEAEVARAAAEWLDAERPPWHLAELNGLREADPAARELELALGARGARADEEEHPCSAIALPRDFEEYLARVSSKFRRRYRQRTNKLLRSCEVRFLRAESDADLSAQLAVLFRLHQARWIEAGRPGAFADRRTRSFYLDVSRRLLRSGGLRFWHLEADGAIRASQFGFAYNGVLHSLQEAYDSEFSPPGVGGLGVVLRGHVLRTAIEEGLRSYDFLGGVEDHKLRWGASVHYVRRVRFARPGATGRGAWLATVGAKSARESVKSALPEPVLDALRAGRASYHRRRGRRG
jgi:CelD/BcsL family acetyltransferase involved in cellulose biosynthesis